MDKSQEYNFLHPWLKTGLLTSTGGKWRSRRKMLTPAFHFRILNDFVSVFNEQAVIMMEKLAKCVDGDAIDIFPYITLCALDVICETAMGKNVNAQLNGDTDYVQAVYRMSNITLNRMRSPWLWHNAMFYTIGSGYESDRCLSVLQGFTMKVINERRSEVKKLLSETSEKKNPDEVLVGHKKRLAFLDMLLCHAEDGTELSNENIQEEVDTFMFEGHDTTAAAMTWAIHLVGANPQIQQKVQDELDTIFGESTRPSTMEDLRQMSYLECVIKEALRLFPSVPMFGRDLAEDTQMGKYHIPGGTSVVIVPKMLHMDPHYFPDPEKFDPDRFLADTAAARHPYSYIPFSAGLRNCIGQKFALLEEKVLLSSILRKYNIKSMQKREELNPIGELILRPENGIHIKLTKR